MKVRYTRRALRQMADILDYIEARSPQGADNVSKRLQAVIDLLADHPEAGRVANKGNFRRIVASPYPYVIFYRSDAAGIVIPMVFAMLPGVPSKLSAQSGPVDSGYVII